jgi:hypothetical protein
VGAVAVDATFDLALAPGDAIWLLTGVRVGRRRVRFCAYSAVW